MEMAQWTKYSSHKPNSLSLKSQNPTQVKHSISHHNSSASMVRWEVETGDSLEVMGQLTWHRVAGDPVLNKVKYEPQHPRLISGLYAYTMAHMSHTHKYTNTHTYMCTYMSMHTYSHTSMHTHSHMYTYSYTHIHTRTCMCTHMYVYNTCIHIYSETEELTAVPTSLQISWNHNEQFLGDSWKCLLFYDLDLQGHSSSLIKPCSNYYFILQQFRSSPSSKVTQLTLVRLMEEASIHWDINQSNFKTIKTNLRLRHLELPGSHGKKLATALCSY